jgi:hypothetical protein
MSRKRKVKLTVVSHNGKELWSPSSAQATSLGMFGAPSAAHVDRDIYGVQANGIQAAMDE